MGITPCGSLFLPQRIPQLGLMLEPSLIFAPRLTLSHGCCICSDVKRAVSTTTACTVSTGGSSPYGSGGFGGCCADTHRSDLSTSHHEEEGSEHEHEDRGPDSARVEVDNRRESLDINEVFRQTAAAEEDGHEIKSSSLDEVAAHSEEFLHIDTLHDKTIEQVYSGVRDGPVLGEGVCGIVRRITHRSTRESFALKRLDLSNVRTDDELRRLREEIFIMCQLDHPNIVRLEEVYENPNEIFLVGELLDGGELFDRLDEQPDYHYTEAECARLIMQMLCAVRYIHSKGIVHRDLKLENFLFASRRPDAPLKMIDFGLSKHFNIGDTQCEVVGTPYTVAPEVVRGRYDERCDVWGVGVLAFFLLSGDPPFGGCGGPEPLHEVRENILAGRYEFKPRDIWEEISDDAKDFIRTLLVTDPSRRPTGNQAQCLKWLVNWERGRMERGHSASKLNVVHAIKKSRSGDCLHSHLGNLGIINFGEEAHRDSARM
uniref:Protein kinase domain-containing protein n=1 Tax=Odontella aurita TaxID=265563 RepID=A0A6U6KNF2_9STRA|mmetsp:Transcript_61836/g.182571  ORF Transcript_61836/g.182571 Transcript_61836/m.182571 type:complete len:486 (+) Transcript_61836:539-1996(+)